MCIRRRDALLPPAGSLRYQVESMDVYSQGDLAPSVAAPNGGRRLQGQPVVNDIDKPGRFILHHVKLMGVVPDGKRSGDLSVGKPGIRRPVSVYCCPGHPKGTGFDSQANFGAGCRRRAGRPDHPRRLPGGHESLERTGVGVPTEDVRSRGIDRHRPAGIRSYEALPRVVRVLNASGTCWVLEPFPQITPSARIIPFSALVEKGPASVPCRHGSRRCRPISPGLVIQEAECR